MSGSKSTKLEALAGGKNEVMNKSALNYALAMGMRTIIMRDS